MSKYQAEFSIYKTVIWLISIYAHIYNIMKNHCIPNPILWILNQENPEMKKKGQMPET